MQIIPKYERLMSVCKFILLKKAEKTVKSYLSSIYKIDNNLGKDPLRVIAVDLSWDAQGIFLGRVRWVCTNIDIWIIDGDASLIYVTTFVDPFECTKSFLESLCHKWIANQFFWPSDESAHTSVRQIKIFQIPPKIKLCVFFILCHRARGFFALKWPFNANTYLFLR